jgi:anti-sigma factor RsiW
MDCEQAIERLPWLLNSTLEPEERRQVRAHVASCEACRQALDETRLAWQVFDEHLPAEVLTALAADEEPGIDRGLAERHLAECPRCAAELEMVRASRALLENEGVATLPVRRARPAGEGWRGWRSAALAAGLAGLVAATGWYNSSRDLRSMAERQQAPPAVSEPAQPAEPAEPAGPTGGVPAGPDDSGRLATLEEENRRLSRANQEAAERIARLEAAEAPAEPAPSTTAASRIAAVNTLVVDVYPETVVRGEESGGNRIELPASTDLYTLLLHPPGEAPARAEIAIVDARGREVWKSAGLVKSSADDYTVTLGRGLLPAGAYTIRLYAAGDRKAPVATFPLTLR